MEAVVVVAARLEMKMSACLRLSWSQLLLSSLVASARGSATPRLCSLCLSLSLSLSLYRCLSLCLSLCLTRDLCLASLSVRVTVTVPGLWDRLRLEREKLTGTRFTLVPSLLRAPTRDMGELGSLSLPSLECLE